LIGDGKKHDADTARRLRAVVASTTLRRTKDMTDAAGQRIVKLPGIAHYVHKVKLHREAREMYDLVAEKVAEIAAKVKQEKVQDLRESSRVVSTVGVLCCGFTSVRARVADKPRRPRFTRVASRLGSRHAVVYLLRLRQLACDPDLCPKSFIDELSLAGLVG
jgi:SWI/SNF-related matrix-associated actin-dependent regulator of chromatin subfamily A3